MNIIETQSLSRSFKRVDAVRDLDITVPQGSVFALIGPNGAGKTTTIKLLMNLVRPSRGEARVLGVDTRALDRLDSAHCRRAARFSGGTTTGSRRRRW